MTGDFGGKVFFTIGVDLVVGSVLLFTLSGGRESGVFCTGGKVAFGVERLFGVASGVSFEILTGSVFSSDLRLRGAEKM
jgi:hypothetical protein